jgi:tRNA pseudouridine55 synthase
MNGILPVYKPVDITSYDVIRAFKRSVRPTFKIGHAGTLDPFADGVMLLMLGESTKQFDELQKLPKTYLATAVLGARSDTLDKTGIITPLTHDTMTSLEEIQFHAKKFVGVIEQKIPDYSAAKIGGKPRYVLARKGADIPAKSKHVTVYSIEVLSLVNNVCMMRISCSSGTYIRQLSYDIFHALGIESYLDALKRESVGPYTIDTCCQIADFEGGAYAAKLSSA